MNDAIEVDGLRIYEYGVASAAWTDLFVKDKCGDEEIDTAVYECFEGCRGSWGFKDYWDGTKDFCSSQPRAGLTAGKAHSRARMSGSP